MRWIAALVIAVALGSATSAEATDYGPVDPGETLRVPCWMPAKNAHVFTPPTYGHQELGLESYSPASDDGWSAAFNLDPYWHAQVSSFLPTEGDLHLGIKTLAYNDGLRRMRFSGTCQVYAPRVRR